MDLDFVFLGTAGSVPTPRRGLSAGLLRRGGERILFDCGEGTQRQLMRSTGMGDIDSVLITHLHTDHVLGLPGMLKTFNLRERQHPLLVVGPPGMAAMWRLLRPIVGRLMFPVEVVEATDGWSHQGDGYDVRAFPTEHSVPSVGYCLREHERAGRFDIDAARALGVPDGPLFGRLQAGERIQLPDGASVDPRQVVGEARRGRSVVYTGDTKACAAVREAAANATLLIHEATFCTDEQERAAATAHSTARDAALTAAAADVSLLALTHISSRYGGREMLAEAQSVFPNVFVARDFDLVELPFPERGEPRLLRGGARERGPRSAAEAQIASDSEPVDVTTQ